MNLLAYYPRKQRYLSCLPDDLLLHSSSSSFQLLLPPPANLRRLLLLLPVGGPRSPVQPIIVTCSIPYGRITKPRLPAGPYYCSTAGFWLLPLLPAPRVSSLPALAASFCAPRPLTCIRLRRPRSPLHQHRMQTLPSPGPTRGLTRPPSGLPVPTCLTPAPILALRPLERLRCLSCALPPFDNIGSS